MNLVKEKQGGLVPPGLKRWPFKHFADTTRVSPSPAGPGGCCPLNFLNLWTSETWPLTKTNLQRLQRNDRAMIRQICSNKSEDVATVRSMELLAKVELDDLDLILRERRLRWFGQVERSSGAVRSM